MNAETFLGVFSRKPSQPIPTSLTSSRSFPAAGFSKHIFLSIFLPQTVRGGDSPLYLYHNAKQAKK